MGDHTLRPCECPVLHQLHRMVSASTDDPCAWINYFTGKGMQIGGFLMLSLLLHLLADSWSRRAFCFFSCLSLWGLSILSFNLLYYFTVIFFILLKSSPNWMKKSESSSVRCLWKAHGTGQRVCLGSCSKWGVSELSRGSSGRHGFTYVEDFAMFKTIENPLTYHKVITTLLW